jgi:hypothetical protein
MTVPDLETPEPPEPVQAYVISFERLRELKRSALAMIADRRPAACPSRLSPDNELTDVQELVDEIAEYSSDDEDFIRSEMPVQEILFRLLLIRRNQPTPLYDLHYELTENWSTPMRPINLTEEGLIRVLEADTYYGFHRLDLVE